MQLDGFPGLQIDDFGNKNEAAEPKLCLLSHAHSDHLKGLERWSYYGPPVYCSAATRHLVRNIRDKNCAEGKLKYEHLKKESRGIELLKILEFGKPYALSCGDTIVEVTMLPVAHCPGSSMFLLKNSDKTVLYTGDLLCEQWNVDALLHESALVEIRERREPLIAYVDSSFLNKANIECDYPPNQEGVDDLLKLIETYPVNTIFTLCAHTLGYEYVLLAVAARLQSKIHLSKYWAELYYSVACCDAYAHSIMNLATSKPEDARLHWCPRTGECSAISQSATVVITPTVGLSRERIELKNLIYDASLANGSKDVVPGMVYSCRTRLLKNHNGEIIEQECEMRFIGSKSGASLLPTKLNFSFSRHASFVGLKRLLASFNLAQVNSLDGKCLPQFDSLIEKARTTIEASKSLHSGAKVEQHLQLPLYGRRTESLTAASKPKRRKVGGNRSYASSSSSDNNSVLCFLNEPKTEKNVSILHDNATDPDNVEFPNDNKDQEDARSFFLRSKFLCPLTFCDPEIAINEKSEVDGKKISMSTTCANANLMVRSELEKTLRLKPELWFELSLDFRRTKTEFM